MKAVLKFGSLTLALGMVLALTMAFTEAAVACGGPEPQNCAEVASECEGDPECIFFFENALACGSACGEDGRVNTNCSAPEIVYCGGGNANFVKFDYFTGEGTADFSIPLADLTKSVTTKTLIKQDGQVKVYLLPDGTVELLAPQPDGKIYFMVFDPTTCSSVQEGAEWGLK